MVKDVTAAIKLDVAQLIRVFVRTIVIVDTKFERKMMSRSGEYIDYKNLRENGQDFLVKLKTRFSMLMEGNLNSLHDEIVNVVVSEPRDMGDIERSQNHKISN